jgi:hypothetical protein
MGQYRAEAGEIASATLTAQQWNYVWVAQAIAEDLGHAHDAWSQDDREHAQRLLSASLSKYGSYLDRLDSIPAVAIYALNNLGFMELAAGHLPQAREFLERCAVKGGLRADGQPDDIAVLLCNLAAATAGLGDYSEAEEWAREALIAARGLNSLTGGWLIPYSPHPDWTKSPPVVASPDIECIAGMTAASIRAALGDRRALDEARAWAVKAQSPWADKIVAEVALHLGADAS